MGYGDARMLSPISNPEGLDKLLTFKSVRVNPDQFFWERRENTSQEMPTRVQDISEDSLSPTHGPRPPSYISDDGISYAVYAMPEVRTEQWPILPPHPSELNRLPLPITSPVSVVGT